MCGSLPVLIFFLRGRDKYSQKGDPRQSITPVERCGVDNYSCIRYGFL